MKFGMQAVITAQVGKGEELADILKEGVEELMANDDCQVYLIQVSVEEPEKVYISELWSNEQAHKSSLTNPVVRAVITRAMPLIASVEAHPTRHLGGKFS